MDLRRIFGGALAALLLLTVALPAMCSECWTAKHSDCVVSHEATTKGRDDTSVSTDATCDDYDQQQGVAAKNAARHYSNSINLGCGEPPCQPLAARIIGISPRRGSQASNDNRDNFQRLASNRTDRAPRFKSERSFFTDSRNAAYSPGLSPLLNLKI
jgi:hypothetical protein